MRSSVEVVRNVRSGIAIRELVRAARQTLSAVRAQGTLTLVLTGDAEVRALNTRYRRRRRTTDVLSFPGIDRQRFVAGSKPHLGDVIISVSEARREALKKGISLKDELCLLVVHGVLHCLGYDHERPKDAKKMLPLQEKILKKA